MMDIDPATLIARLRLAPHPEGGWFRETWREPSPIGGRGLATAILFLLEAGQRSARHRVDAAELWLWHAGSPLDLVIDGADGSVIHRLGADILGGAQPHILVPAHAWQSTAAATGWALVSCVVVPAFDFAGFTLDPDD